MRPLLAAALAVAAASCQRAGDEPAPRPPSRDPAKDAAWTQLLGTLRADRIDAAGTRTATSVALLDALPKPVTLAFFATYCPPCVDEMDDLDALAKEGKPVAGVSMDSGNDAALRALLARKRVRYPLYVLTSTSMKAVGLAMDEGLPLTLLVGAGGEVRGRLIGRSSRARLEAALR